MTRSRSSQIFLLVLFLCVALPAAGQTRGFLGANEADALVRAQWFEGMPDELIAPLSAEAVQHLGAILDDPTDTAAHAPALELLGRAGGAGGAGAYEEIVAFASRTPSGDVSAAVYRAQIAVPLALGYLARGDDRAIAPLLAAAADTAPRSWRYLRLDERGVADERRKMAITGLALSGRAAARRGLESMAADDRMGDHVADALTLYRSRAAGRDER